MKHFKLTKNTKNFYGIKLYQIQATKDLSNGIKKGTLGGYIQFELNISGNAWVSGNAQVYGYARVSGNAQVSGDARVYGNAQVYGNAWVSGNAQVYGNAWVSGNAQVFGDARVSGNAQVPGDARVSGNARVTSLESLLVLVIAMKYSVTVTKSLIFIGCKVFKTKDVLKLTQRQADEFGLDKKYYQAYKEMIKGALRIVR